MTAVLADVTRLIDEARASYAGDAVAEARLDAYARRVREPLRLAVAGIVKAGKSTLLNALIGEQIAPTDAGECTRTVTAYRYGRSASITAHLHGGAEVRLPVSRSDGALILDLGRRTADEVAWIDVVWPSESLRSTVLIDTPGIASTSVDVSERSHGFLTPTRSPSEADAILYLLRHIHESDVRFLEAFRDTAAGVSQTVNAVALLSRADEIGSGRIDALISAARIAERYRRDGELRSLALECIPVAGLLAEGARTHRESEFATFRSLAELDRDVRDRMLVSVDRFIRPSAETTTSVAERRHLLDRFGLFGVRLGTALVRGGARTSSQLSQRMIAQSGLVDVQRFVADHFRARASSLKARSVLVGLEMLLEDRPIAAAARISSAIEEIRANAHDLRELALLARLRADDTPLEPADAVAAERLLGGAGTSASARLGLADDADDAAIHERLTDALVHWRRLAGAPLADRAATDVCRDVIRSVEGLASELAWADGSDGSGRADIVSAGRPA